MNKIRLLRELESGVNQDRVEIDAYRKKIISEIKKEGVKTADNTINKKPKKLTLFRRILQVLFG